MIESNPQGEVWIFAQQDGGQIHDVPLELMSKARGLADTLKVPLSSVLLGDQVRSQTDRLIWHGADRVYLVEDPRLGVYQTNSYAKVLVDLVHKHKPQIVLFGATVLGRDLAPRVASACRCGLTADCTDLEIGDHTDLRSGKVYKNLLYQIRPAFGGAIIATIVNTNRWPQMATVREGVMPMPDADRSRTGPVIDETAELSDSEFPLRIVEQHRRSKKVDLKAARVVVAGGAGVGSKDNFKKIWDLANALGGAVGGSRAAVDSGYIAHDHQVGQTGTTVRPALYVAAGISGAVQHRVGMEESAKIIAINKDPEAPIFQVAHYGIVADLNVAIPKLIKAIKARA